MGCYELMDERKKGSEVLLCKTAKILMKYSMLPVFYLKNRGILSRFFFCFPFTKILRSILKIFGDKERRMSEV